MTALAFRLISLLITLVELLDATACLNVTLTTRKDRMALGANINTKLLLRGTRLERVAAAASYRSFKEFRMNPLLHTYTPLFPPNQQILHGIDTRKLCASLV